MPSKLPDPSNSRTEANTLNPSVNPIPIPNASKIESTTGFLQAKLSARPKIMQFTTINGIKIPSWVPKLGGKGINLPKIPMLARGTDNWSGGIAQVHEKGGEIIDLPRGTRVYPHDKSVQMARNQGNKTYKIEKFADTIVVREEADIDKIAEKLAEKLEAIPA